MSDQIDDDAEVVVWDENEKAAPVPSRADRADQIIARAMLDSAVPPDLLERLRANDGVCVVLETHAPGWGRAIRREIAMLKIPATIVVREPGDKAGSTDDESVAMELAGGRSVVAISPMPEALLGRSVIASADIRITLRPPTDAQVRAAIARVTRTRRSRRRLPCVAALTPTEIAAAIRTGSTARACAERLHRAVESLTRTREAPPPPLTALGLQDTVYAWAVEIVAEARRALNGEIPLDALPRGAILAGPPGTGKTLLAQALAHAAGLPLVATSVGEWMGGGHLGACITAMQSAFARARSRSPSILFVDELDGLVDPQHQRGGGESFWMSLRSALLTAIDGAAVRPGLVLIGACNHIDFVDAALRRAGRFDRVVSIDPPDAAGLATILRTHLDTDLSGADLGTLARLALGQTGADVARAVRSARAQARQAGRPLRASDLAAHLAPADTRPPALRRTIAIHEAGHALAAIRLGQPLRSLSLIGDAATGGAVSFAMDPAVTRAVIDRTVIVLLAGRAADAVVGGAPLGNARADLVQATRLLTDAHARMGLGRSLLALEIEGVLLSDPDLRSAVEADLERLQAAAVEIITQDRDAVVALADALERHRVLDGPEATRIVMSVCAQPREGATATPAL